MQPPVTEYRKAAWRGTRWLLTQQNEDGSFVNPDLQADVYHKAILALGLTGHVTEACHLLSWIKAHDLQASGETADLRVGGMTADLQVSGRLRRFDDGLALYKDAWICQGAHRMGRLDISMPVMEYLLSCQAPCGGFFQTPALNQYVEPVCTAWAAVCALYMGRMEAVARAADCLEQMWVQQPDPTRFYFQMSPDGRLIVGDAFPHLDATRPQQAYYCPGIAQQFFVRLYLATGEARALRVAQELFEFSLRCAEDRYSWPAAGKSAVGAGLLWLATGDERARAAACEFADYLLREQNADGWWCNPLADNTIIRLDHTAEFVVWLTEIAAWAQ